MDRRWSRAISGFAGALSESHERNVADQREFARKEKIAQANDLRARNLYTWKAEEEKRMSDEAFKQQIREAYPDVEEGSTEWGYLVANARNLIPEGTKGISQADQIKVMEYGDKAWENFVEQQGGQISDTQYMELYEALNPNKPIPTGQDGKPNAAMIKQTVEQAYKERAMNKVRLSSGDSSYNRYRNIAGGGGTALVGEQDGLPTLGPGGGQGGKPGGGAADKRIIYNAKSKKHLLTLPPEQQQEAMNNMSPEDQKQARRDIALSNAKKDVKVEEETALQTRYEEAEEGLPKQAVINRAKATGIEIDTGAEEGKFDARQERTINRYVERYLAADAKEKVKIQETLQNAPPELLDEVLKRVDMILYNQGLN